MGDAIELFTNSAIKSPKKATKNLLSSMLLAFYLAALAAPAEQQLEPVSLVSACPVGCTEASSVVHGDPMFKVNGEGVHFWIKEGVPQKLMRWTDPVNGNTLELAGKTFGHPTTNNQWFDEFQLKREGIRVAHVYMQDGKMLAYSNSAPFAQDGNLEVILGGLKMRIFNATASKFSDAAEQAKYAHLNIDFETALPQSAIGTFAELVGIKPMSEATKATLKPAAIADVTQLDRQVACVCPPPASPPSE